MPICRASRGAAVVVLLLLGAAINASGKTLKLSSATMTVAVDAKTGRWNLRDRRSGVRWPTEGLARAGTAKALAGNFAEADTSKPDRIRLVKANGAAVVFALADAGRGLELRYEGNAVGDVSVLSDALGITNVEGGYAIVPCREGLLIPANSGKSFRRTFGTSDYEGCHMNVLGFVKAGSVLAVTWSDAYVLAELASTQPRGQKHRQRLTATFRLRRSARSLRVWPLGQGDWNTLAAGYRRVAEGKKLAVTLTDKIRRDAHAERMVGAANVKLWTCLARRMNEQSTKEESVTVRWTFDEAARIAEHIRKDLGIERCLFMMGGWTAGGYDCRHPDNLPANPECGGNDALAKAVQRIQKLGYVACLHDNVQDMYRDAKSFDLDFIEKRPDGSPITGGRWLGGRAYMVCAPKQLELARRPQNLPAIRKLFAPWSYFIDTTYAVGPRECHDPNHPLGRNDDIAFKKRLSDYTRQMFGLFGSECGREWALPHSDFFEGLVGVSGKYFHMLKPESLGATVVPFWEMVYHDCQICWGKYGYKAEAAAEYVAHHVLCARPLNYHSLGDHLYWKAAGANKPSPIPARPRVVSVKPDGKRAFRIRYAWDVGGDVTGDFRAFVHFGTDKDILFQDDHTPDPPTTSWRKGRTVEIGPHTVRMPASVRRKSVNVYVGLFSKTDVARRAPLPGCDAQRRILLGRLHLTPVVSFEPASRKPGADRACYTRSDGGWARGLHPIDVFLKNTQEVLGPLHEATAHVRLTKLEFLTADRSLRRATYGRGAQATTVTVNFGPADADVTLRPGGRTVLPSWGFVVRSAAFEAFHAKRHGGVDFPRGALFTLRALDGKPLAQSGRVRVFHGFGPAVLRWRGREYNVPREQVIQPK